MAPRQLIDPRWAGITAAVVLIIIWGSLYPFSFYPRGSLTAGLRFLIDTWPYPPDRGDLISNILLYSPLGFFAVRSLRRPGFPARAALVTLFGTCLSAGMELTQYWDAGRAPSVADLYSNALGTLAGAAVAGLNPRAWDFPLLGKMNWRPYALLLVVFWLGYRLFPYVPAYGWRAYDPLPLYRDVVDWLAVAMLIEALFGIERSRIAVALLAACLIAGRILMGAATPVEEVATVAAAALWIGAVSRLRFRAELVAILFTGSVLLQAMEPFHFEAHARRFHWIPFVSFIDGPRENGVRVFLDKAFTYGAFVWLAARTGLSWTTATVGCGALVLGSRFAQVYLPGRSAEITDVAMLVMLAAMMRLMRDVPGRY